MRLADTGRAEKDNVLGALDEGQAGEFMDLLARRAAGKTKVKPVERLYRREAGDPGEHLTGAGPPRVTLGTQDLFQKVCKGSCLCHRALSNRPIKIGNRVLSALAPGGGYQSSWGTLLLVLGDEAECGTRHVDQRPSGIGRSARRKAIAGSAAVTAASNSTSAVPAF